MKNWDVRPAMCVGANGIADSVADAADVPQIPQGQGWPDIVQAVTNGPNGVRDTPLAGDDQPNTGGISCGANGVCESTAMPDDVQNIQVGMGLRHELVVSLSLPLLRHPASIVCGSDTVLTSVPSGDDHRIDTIDLYMTVQIVDALGVAAQNNADPTSFFENHAVVHRGGLIYDPSYGGGPFALSDTTCAGHEDAAMSAVSFFGTWANLQNTAVSELRYVPQQ